jgi:hypothetical protein
MIDIGKILKRAWHILWSYKILWIFGILLVLTAGGSGGGNGGSSSRSSYQGSNGYQGVTPSTNPQVQQLNQWFQTYIEPLGAHPEQHIATFIWIAVAVFLFFLILGALLALVRFPTEAAVIRMVDDYEQTGTKVGFKQGWKLGWSRRAFRMWWIHFLTQDLPGIVFFLLILSIGVGVFFNIRNGNVPAIVAGSLAAVAGIILILVVFILGMTFLRLLNQFYWREVALNDAGTREAFRTGWATFKRNWKSAGLMWLVMVGIGIGAGIVLAIALFVLIPAYIILAVPAALVAAIPGLVAFGITSLFGSTLVAGIVGALVALPFFFLVVLSPFYLVSGWFSIYESSIWTLTYREIKALESVAPVTGPKIAK